MDYPLMGRWARTPARLPAEDPARAPPSRVILSAAGRAPRGTGGAQEPERRTASASSSFV
ncbi:hypothetical protein GCM10022202_34440 [Microbacterium marinilacus]|uniref:Uncharacterized protein n=1 Tax=Microbacterium marinilacus TaxID=415209 RepID=A0ABP7BW99_9MICO